MKEETKLKIRYISSLVALFVLFAVIEVVSTYFMIRHPIGYAITSYFLLTVILIVSAVFLFKVIREAFKSAKSGDPTIGEDTKTRIDYAFVCSVVAMIIVFVAIEMVGTYFMIKHPTGFAITAYAIITILLIVAVVFIFKIIQKSYKNAKLGKPSKLFGVKEKE